ncbi:ABC transporter ATP-binding protein [Candidatus Methanodesulfokora washburnensis]|uniref:ABC transporter ATP-binding protein n=1 Tax=Candidatus Methanodesulfokora washburnensis TaxID=2478471 RepID=A0A3R9QYU2_9CREN|nr:ABC transporter ATP-binding protein [Candidatus Methanodesulfokores washburnensis]
MRYTGDLLIELLNVRKGYGSVEVLKGVNLRIEEGDFASIRGKSGAGKTTMLRIMGLLDPPDEGEIKLFGIPASRLNDDERSKLRLHNIGFVFQFFNLIPSLTVRENIELPLALAGIRKEERRNRVTELLRYFDLINLAERFPDTLSGGERQRVAVMRALANNPRIILADEPTSSLDDENSELLMDLFRRINREKRVAIVMTTTDLYEKLPTNRDFVLKDGRLTEFL